MFPLKTDWQVHEQFNTIYQAPEERKWTDTPQQKEPKPSGVFEETLTVAGGGGTLERVMDFQSWNIKILL